MVERTNEFFLELSSYDTLGSSERTLKNTSRNYFHEAAYKITQIINSISSSIQENSAAYIDKYSSVISMKSHMTDEDRTIFCNQISQSIVSAEKLMADLAKEVNSGKTGVKDDELTHYIGVFDCLNLALNNLKNTFFKMQNKRKYFLTKFKDLDEKLPKVQNQKIKLTKYEQEKQEVSPEYQYKLEIEQQSIVDDMNKYYDRVTQIERTTEEIQQMFSSYQQLMEGQTEQIRIIRENVESAADNYDEGTKQIDKAAKRAKKEHLMHSLVILFLSLILVITQIRNNHKHL